MPLGLRYVKEKILDFISLIKKNPKHYCQFAGYIVQLIYGVFCLIYGFFRSLGVDEGGAVLPESVVGFIMLPVGIALVGFGIGSILGMYDSYAKVYRDKYLITGIDIAINIAAIALTTDAIQFIFFPIICIGFYAASFFFKNAKRENDYITNDRFYHVDDKTPEQIEEIEQKFKQLKESGVIADSQYEDLIKRLEVEKAKPAQTAESAQQ